MNSPHRRTSFFLALALPCLAGCATHDATAPRPLARPRVMPGATPLARTPAPEAFTTALEQAQRGDIAAAARTVASLADWEERDRHAAQIAGALAETNIERAVAFAHALPADRGRAAALEATAHARVRQDENAALTWALGIGDPSSRRVAIQAVTAHGVRTDPARTLNRILALPAEAARDEAARTAAAQWVRQDANAALAWLRELPESASKPGLTASMGFELAQKDPRAALALCETMPAGIERRLVWIAAAQTWAAQDEAAATKWVAQLPAGESRELALQGFNLAMGVGDGSSGVAVRRRR